MNNDDQFTRKTTIPQEKFLGLVHLVLTTTWYTFNFQFYPKNWWRCNGRPSTFNHSRNLYAGLWTHSYNYGTAPSRSFGRICWWRYSILKRMHLENLFHHINNRHQKMNFAMEDESNGELAFRDTLLKRNNGEISVLVYRKLTHTHQYLNYSSHHQTDCK